MDDCHGIARSSVVDVKMDARKLPSCYVANVKWQLFNKRWAMEDELDRVNFIPLPSSGRQLCIYHLSEPKPKFLHSKKILKPIICFQ